MGADMVAGLGGVRPSLKLSRLSVLHAEQLPSSIDCVGEFGQGGCSMDRGRESASRGVGPDLVELGRQLRPREREHSRAQQSSPCGERQRRAYLPEGAVLVAGRYEAFRELE
ncbi:MAG: hypothetical protein LC790_13280 [Actinobacteria bacterium]|nr:hypothetical protein [Actinomycetota bacterium]